MTVYDWSNYDSFFHYPRSESGKFKFVLLSRLFTLSSFCSTVVLWKGWWDACEVMFMVPNQMAHLTSLALMLVVVILGMTLAGYARSNLAFPLVFSIDQEHKYYPNDYVGEKVIKVCLIILD